MRLICNLIKEGGEVGSKSLAKNLTNARLIVTVSKGGAAKGVGVLKRPQMSYRKKISAKTGLPLEESEYPYELGYVFIRPELRRRGISHAVIAALLDHDDGRGVFATVRTNNAAMRFGLSRAGFVACGFTYLSERDDSELGVLLKPSTKCQASLVATAPRP